MGYFLYCHWRCWNISWTFWFLYQKLLHSIISNSLASGIFMSQLWNLVTISHIRLHKVSIPIIYICHSGHYYPIKTCWFSPKYSHFAPIACLWGWDIFCKLLLYLWNCHSMHVWYHDWQYWDCSLYMALWLILSGLVLYYWVWLPCVS